MICFLPDRPAALVHATAPELPPMALYQGIYGVVRVRVALDASGAVRDAVVVVTPSRVLERESLRAARASTFAPARRHCAHVASTYEFRVLYAEDGPRASPLPGPSPSPSPTPLPKPDLAKPWELMWATVGSYSFTQRTVTSSGVYTQLYDTFPISHRAECRGALDAPALERVAAALRAARPETWRGSYRLADDPSPSPSPAAVRTPRPAVDVIAAVRENRIFPGIMDAANASLTLDTGGITYRVGYEYGATIGNRETVPAGIADLARVLGAATPERCSAHANVHATND
ncbi:MAG TPA: TonB family protein [Xanthomonadales bacterium]|nr:TonB family protein [Xanthomonadales bacterium]